MMGVINKLLKFFFADQIEMFHKLARQLQMDSENLRQDIVCIKKEMVKVQRECSELCKAILLREALFKGDDTEQPIPDIKLCDAYRQADMDYYYEKLRETAPDAFIIWRELVEVNKKSYAGFPLHSCSVEGHPSASFFKLFVRPFLCGRVLDIGCGPQPVPVYLKDYPVQLISGIDPIALPQDHPFEFVQGVAEFMPWQDESFDVVIAATSLDHVLLLEKVYGEVRRVLSTKGRFLIWVAFIDGAEPYDPFKPDIKAVDVYHLFHFDKAWFEESIERFFLIEEVLRVNIGIDHHFYSLVPNNNSKQQHE